MKILKEGKIPEPLPPWWVGQKHKCNHCRTEIEFEFGDSVRESSMKDLGGKKWLLFKCPFCRKEQAHQQVIMR